ncbi:MAG: HAD family hydrolase [Myxococcota bacterium]
MTAGGADGAEPETLAFFDMDLTLVGANTGKLWVRDAFRRGEVGALTMGRLMFAALRYRLGLMDPGPLMHQAAETLAGTPESALSARCEVFFEEEVRPRILRRAVDRLRRHRRRGHRIVLLSASTPYVVGRLGEHLEVEHVLCTRLEVQEGVLTGRLSDRACYGEGKLHAASRFAVERGASLESSWFYTDSIHDLPLLEVVGNPVAVNPDPRLERVARRRGWPVEDFFGDARRR